MQTINDIYLNTLGKGIMGLDAAQKALLVPIANTCYQEGGEAVFTARRLLTLTGNMLDYDDEVICTGVGGRSANVEEQTDSSIAFKLFPNPAKDLVQLEWGGNFRSDATGELVLIDQTGRQLLGREIDLSTRSFSLATNELPAGLYLFEVREQGKTLFSEKLVLVK